MIYMMISIKSIKSWRCRTEHARYFLSHYVTIVIAVSDQISCVDWKRELQAELYGFMVAPPKYLLIEDGRRPYCEDREMELLERPTKKLKTVLHNERLTLLGLARVEGNVHLPNATHDGPLRRAKVVHLRLETLQTRTTRLQRRGHCRLGSSIHSRLIPPCWPDFLLLHYDIAQLQPRGTINSNGRDVSQL
jgi:hypothetical protein